MQEDRILLRGVDRHQAYSPSCKVSLNLCVHALSDLKATVMTFSSATASTPRFNFQNAGDTAMREMEAFRNVAFFISNATMTPVEIRMNLFTWSWELVCDFSKRPVFRFHPHSSLRKTETKPNDLPLH